MSNSDSHLPPNTQIVLLPVEKIHHNHYSFPKQNQNQIRQAILQQSHLPIQTILRYLYYAKEDNGIQLTLINRLFDCSNTEMSYYVPELVYMAINRNCRSMKKMLVSRARHDEAMRRLIYWNLRAFTVLTRNKSMTLKRSIQIFEESLVTDSHKDKNKTKFTHSLKAISVLTQASLTLKTFPKECLQDKLKTFIQRYNSQFLNNLKHEIIIPFRKEQNDKHDSNFVVGIIEDDYSCFPTNKRVPYRIIIETIDRREIKKMDEQLLTKDRVPADPYRDLYTQVLQKVEAIFMQQSLKIAEGDNSYPFVVDKEEGKRYSQMKSFMNSFDNDQIGQQKQVYSKYNLIGISMRSIAYSVRESQYKKPNPLIDYVIRESNNLKKFDAIFIPNLSGHIRKSEIVENQFASSIKINKKEKRKSDNSLEEQNHNVMTYKEELKERSELSEAIWGLPWELKRVKYHTHSLFRKLESHKLRNVVVKGGDDLRQQIICMQLIYKIRDILKKAGPDILIKPYEVIVLSQNSGILQFVANSVSIDQIKRKTGQGSLVNLFNQIYQTQDRIHKAKQNFVRSLVGSSILTYVLSLKDRHNGNILIDIEGNIIHIDFGFILGLAPGNVNFESSPFKLTEEYMDIMSNEQEDYFQKFCDLFCQGMLALRLRVEELTLIIQIMMEDSDLDCFKNFSMDAFRDIFKPHYSDSTFRNYCCKLIERSCRNSRTVKYDLYQSYFNGILP